MHFQQLSLVFPCGRPACVQMASLSLISATNQWRVSVRLALRASHRWLGSPCGGEGGGPCKSWQVLAGRSRGPGLRGSFRSWFRTAWRVSADPAGRPSTAGGAGIGTSQEGVGVALESGAHSCPPPRPEPPGAEAAAPPLPRNYVFLVTAPLPQLFLPACCASAHLNVSLFMAVSWNPDGALQEAGPPC